MTDDEFKEMQSDAESLESHSLVLGYPTSLETACAKHIRNLIAEVRRLRAEVAQQSSVVRVGGVRWPADPRLSESHD